jgi:hypothetical protein
VTHFACAVLGLGGAVVAVLIRLWPAPRTAPTIPAPGPVPAAFRYCPAELRTRAAVPHRDGSATCSGCGTHIPAGDS